MVLCMADLDSELRQAVSDSEANADGLAVDPVPEGAAKSKRSIGLLIALLVAVGAMLGLVLSSADDAAIYSVTVDKVVLDKASHSGRNLRVEGDLVKGTLRHRAEPCEYRFTMTRGGQELPVRYAECVIPDTFRDVPDMDVQVTAEGELTEEGYLEATHIMAKCPSKYEMQQKKARGETAPHTAALETTDVGVRPMDPSETN
jgi:cytochrome c-type biogenesis protein CcmE